MFKSNELMTKIRDRNNNFVTNSGVTKYSNELRHKFYIFVTNFFF